jgi:hypothetical protein
LLKLANLSWLLIKFTLTVEQLVKNMNIKYLFVSALSGATMILKQFPIHKCGHEDAPKPAAKCVKSMLGVNNPQR